MLIDTDWLPDLHGDFVRPSKLSLDDLPELFIRDEKLADQLGMKKDVVAKLAEQAGVQAEDLDLLMKHPGEFKEWKASIAAKEFPNKESADIERRKKKITEKYQKAPKKKYVKVPQPTNMIDAKTWLNETYKNNAEELICQICKKEMPFKKKDRTYYFEAVEILKDFDREMEELHIALCPLCAAMYNEFVKRDEDAMVSLKIALINSEEPEVSLRFGDLKTSIRFVKSHFHDIRTIITIESP